ncbi:hypothetical protein TruAng_000334 [Truncatella angustata]|nr:hypothetical protein TruAng_000334 [Truncatella angustata]
MRTSPGGEIGKRLLPCIIDEVAQSEPSRAWASLPVDDYDLSQGFEDITYAAFANGINKLAHCIVSAFGRSTSFETIAYLGTPDISSHMNTLDIHLSLFDQTQCRGVLLSRGVYAGDILTQRPMPKAEIPELDDLLNMDDLAEPFPYAKTFEEAASDPFAVCHTSGTTGDPRPVTFTHASMACMDYQTELPDVDGRGHWTWQSSAGTRYLMVASPFHPIAVALAMTVCGFGGGILVPGFRHRPASGTNEICDIIRSSGATTGFIPFFLADVIARRPDGESLIKQFTSMAYGNGSVSRYAGDLWAKYVKFQCIWGTSETLTPPVLLADPEDYEYVYFDVDAAGISFQERDLEYFDDYGSRLPLYELVMTLRPESQRCAGYWAGLGITAAPSAPPYPEYPTAEVWTPHPDPQKERYAWRFVSRLHDLGTGKNEFALAVENLLGNHEKVQNAIVLSKYNREPVALVELSKGIDVQAATDLWKQTIERENENMPEEARVPESNVILTPFGGFTRGSEGHLLRKHTEKKYSSEIDAVYGLCQKKASVSERPRYESIIETTEIVQVVENGDPQTLPIR